MVLGPARSHSVLLTLLACFVIRTEAQPAPITPANPLDPLGVFVVLKCLPVSLASFGITHLVREGRSVQSSSCSFPFQATFLSFALHGVPIDPITSGGTNIGPANGAGPAAFSPNVRAAMQTILDVDSTELRQATRLHQGFVSQL